MCITCYDCIDLGKKKTIGSLKNTSYKFCIFHKIVQNCKFSDGKKINFNSNPAASCLLFFYKNSVIHSITVFHTKKQYLTIGIWLYFESLCFYNIIIFYNVIPLYDVSHEQVYSALILHHFPPSWYSWYT